jgi:hypothetical protein
MAIYAKKTEFEQCPTGNIQAICAYVNDIGNQVSDFNGHESINHQIVISWEVAERKQDGKPFIVSKFYNLYISEKANLRKDVESWHGRKFTDEEMEKLDIETLIGKNCLLNIGLSTKGRSKIVGISPLIKGMPEINIINKQMPEKFSEWIDKLRFESVVKSEEAEKQNGEGNNGLPF